jgi:hypothetical protein
MQGKARFMVLVVTHLAAFDQFRQTIDHVVSMRIEGGEGRRKRAPAQTPAVTTKAGVNTRVSHLMATIR